MKTVLVSVTDKTGLDSFLRRLEHFDDLKLIATTSSAKCLKEQGFACMKVEELTEFPEILSGRVKTLHPRVFAGILARPSKEDRSCLDELDIPEIDIVVVNLYAFEEKLKQNLSEAQMIEQIDIGGVSLLRAAAKNFERVAVISDPKQYDRVLDSIEANAGTITVGLRKQLAYEAIARTASYDTSISGYLASQLKLGVEGTAVNDLPSSINLQLEKVQDLRYGENPHQSAAWYGAIGGHVGSYAKMPPYEQLQGKEMSANNITDAFALVRVLRELESSGVCIIKHNNPCGVAVADKIEDAYDIAYACDPMSAFGGVYGFTETVTAAIAAKIAANFVEIVLAPDFEKEALNIFSKKKNVRVLRMPKDRLKPLQIGSLHIKDLSDFGYLVEKDVVAPVKSSEFKCVTRRRWTQAMLVILPLPGGWLSTSHQMPFSLLVTDGRLALVSGKQAVSHP